MLPFLSNWMSLSRESPFHQSYLQYHRWPLTSTEINPPQARKYMYHAILEYSCGKWVTIFLPFNSFMANLSKLMDLYWTLFKKPVILLRGGLSLHFQYSISWSNAWLLSYNPMTQNIYVVVQYVHYIEKRT